VEGVGTSTVEVSLQVLLATDADDFARPFKAALENAGCKVALAGSGQALLSAASDSYELIFLDLDLAGIDGMNLLKELQHRLGASAPPIILLKGDAEPAHVIQRGFDLGVSGYILKDRVPQGLSARAVMALLRGTGAPPDGGENRRKSPIRPDACPFSVIGRYDGCAVFVPLNSSARNGSDSHVACSHLRAGLIDSWRLYPRCSLGDANARAKYFRDQTA